MGEYLAVAAIVFGVNLLPAFGPPTWSVLIILQGSLELNPVLLVPLGALAATAGRTLLALGARHFRDRLSARRLEGLDALRAELTGSPGRSFAGLGLFLVSPLPSAQLFVGAGVLRVPLAPLAAAFLAGRLVSYSIYVGAATVATQNLLEISVDTLGSPLGIALQLLMLAALVALVRIDWLKVLRVDYPPGTAAGTDPTPRGDG